MHGNGGNDTRQHPLPKFDLWKNFGNQAVTYRKDQRKYDVRNHNRINNMLRKGIYRTGWIYPKIISQKKIGRVKFSPAITQGSWR